MGGRKSYVNNGSVSSQRVNVCDAELAPAYKFLLLMLFNFQQHVISDMSTPIIAADYPWERLETSIITWSVIALTALIMNARCPRDIESGMLRVEARDFFQSQPRIGNEYSSILRHILHDWSDKDSEAAAILGNVDRPLGPRIIAGT
ncbi:hypothetical protein F4604DRAFT_1672977 [Suillus subluteus]|nr:hypothetical protein F4604DRAFT_1672977 [Suillus subluteus]